MNIKKEIKLPNNDQVDREENLSNRFLNISRYTLLEDIPEMLCEWWSGTEKDLQSFLKDEGLSEVIDEQTFIDIVLKKYYFSDRFLVFLKDKVPYNVSIEKLYRRNKTFMKKHPEAECLKLNEELVSRLLKGVYDQKKEDRRQYVRDWHMEHKAEGIEASHKYYQLNKEKIRIRKKIYRIVHKEEIKAYKKSRREIENEQQRLRYHADIEKSREKRRLYNQNMSEEQKAKLTEYKAECSRTHREQINERERERMKDETNRLRKQQKDRARYHQNSAEIQEKKRQKRLNNLEEARAKERAYGKTYRDKHREEIREKNRAKYQENLLESRKKGAERQKSYCARKRFREVTSKMIMPLLSALILSKKEP